VVGRGSGRLPEAIARCQKLSSRTRSAGCGSTTTR
jgi:hypothetical protein